MTYSGSYCVNRAAVFENFTELFVELSVSVISIKMTAITGIARVPRRGRGVYKHTLRTVLELYNHDRLYK